MINIGEHTGLQGFNLSEDFNLIKSSKFSRSSYKNSSANMYISQNSGQPCATLDSGQTWTVDNPGQWTTLGNPWLPWVTLGNPG